MAAFARTPHHQSGPGYLPDRLYRYRYLTTLYTGYTGLKPQYEGNSLRVDVLVQRQSEYFVVKFEHPELAVAKDVHNMEEYHFEYHTSPEFEEIISKPFRVVYQDGQLSHYDVSRDEPEFSLNIKRALLHALNLNFEPKEAVHHQRGGYLHQPDPQASYYTVLEDGKGGKCETSYVINRTPYYRTPYYNNVLNVTKLRNYRNCINEPYHDYNPLHGKHCEECETEKENPIHQNSHYYYNIRGDRHSYIIEKIFSEGESSYIPYTTHGETAYVYENRTFQLVEEKESTEKITLPNDLVSYYDLDFTHGHYHKFDEAVDLKESHYYYDFYKVKVPVEQAGKRMTDLISRYEKVDTATDLNENLLWRYFELIRIFSAYNYEDVHEFYQSYVEGKAEPYRYLFYDILSATGTNPTFLYGVHLIEEEHVTAEVAKEFIQNVVHHIKEPSERLFDVFFRLCDHSFVRRREHLQTTCYLAFSGLIYETCVKEHNDHYEERHHEYGHYDDDSSHGHRYNQDSRRDGHHCTEEIAKKYLDYLVSQYHRHDRHEDDHHEIAFIKILGNSGLRDAIRYLRSYILDVEKPLYFRITAVWALRRMVDSSSEEIVEILSPIYSNYSEDYELRIAAFTVGLKAHPSEYQIETIAHHLYYEPSDQVLSYVYSTFYHLANSTYPCFKRLAKIARNALEILSDLEFDFHHDLDHAFNYISSGYEEKYDYGGFTQFAYVPSNTSYIPRKVYVNFNDYIGGESYDAFALGFHSYGLERYYDRVFGPRGPLSDSPLSHIFGRRTPRDATSVKQEVENIDQKLNIHHRQYPPVYGNVFFKLFDSEVEFFHFNETIIEKFLKDGDYSVLFTHDDEHHPLFYRHFMLETDKTYVFSTESGLPLVYEVKQGIYLHYHNNEFKTELTPDPPKQGFYIPKQIKLYLDGHLVYDRSVQVTFETVLPFTQAVFGVGAVGRSALNVPLKFHLVADLENYKLDYKIVPLIPHEVYQSYFIPFTHFIDMKQFVTGDFYFHNDVHPLYEKDLASVEEDYFQDYFGLGYRVNARYNNIWNDRGSWNTFFHELDFRQKLYYFFCQPHFHPYIFNVTLIGADTDATTELVAIFNYDFYGLEDQDNRPHKSEHFEEDLGDFVSDRKSYTYVLQGDIHTTGQRERKIRTELIYSRSYDGMDQKYSLFYVRTPFHSSETENFKVCSAGYIKYPDYDRSKYYNLETQEFDHAVNSRVNIFFGKDCKTESKITIRGHFDRTEEQKNHEARREEPVTHERFNEYAYYYQKCQEERQHGHKYHRYCLHYLHLVSELHHYNFQINYENLPESFRNLTYKVASCFKHHYYTHADTDVFATNPDSQVTVDFNVSLHDPVVDVRVYKPHETTHYTHIYLPEVHLINTYPSPQNRYFADDFGFFEYPYCQVEKDEVRTFDNVTYTLPPIDCYKVIAKDCSPTEHFLLLGKKIGEQKAILAYFGKYKVEAVPEGSSIVIRVNDKEVTVTDNEPYYQYVTKGDHKVTVFSIARRNEFYKLYSDRFGFKLAYNGKLIYFELLTLYYRGKLCGLCGDNDADEQHEFRGPNGYEYHDTKAFGYSYTLADDQCKLPEYDDDLPKPYNIVDGCTDYRNRHIYYGSRNRKSCFTTHPLPKCAEGCVPTRYVKRNEPFHCLLAKESYSRYLLRESEHRVLDEVRYKVKDHYAEVEYPESCEPRDH